MNFEPDSELGVFTSMRVTDGVAYAVDEHVARLKHSADELYGLTLPIDLADRIVLEASTMQHGRLRVEITPGSGGMTINIHAGEQLDASSLQLKSVVVGGWNGAHKWMHRPSLGSGQSLFVGSANEVLEADHASVFALFGNELATPALGSILPGITRADVIARARRLNFKVCERTILLDEFKQADAAFATNSVRGVMTIKRLDDHQWSEASAKLTEPFSFFG